MLCVKQHNMLKKQQKKAHIEGTLNVFVIFLPATTHKVCIDKCEMAHNDHLQPTVRYFYPAEAQMEMTYHELHAINYLLR